MTDTCTRCGERPAAPGKLGIRCPECVDEVARERGYEVGEG
jgi:tRNA(Ile2) C34 agmatinyltransferase TiaS